MTGEMIKCPKCGYHVKPRGLGSHKDSKRCKVLQVKKEMREKGFKPLFSHRRYRYIKEKYPEAEIIKDKAKYVPSMKFGYWIRRAKAKYGWYVKIPYYERAMEEVMIGPDNAERVYKENETYNYLWVENNNFHRKWGAVIEKWNKEQTRRYSFRYSPSQKERIYTHEGFIFGTITNDCPSEFNSKLVEFELDDDKELRKA